MLQIELTAPHVSYDIIADEPWRAKFHLFR